MSVIYHYYIETKEGHRNLAYDGIFEVPHEIRSIAEYEDVRRWIAKDLGVPNDSMTVKSLTRL